MKDQLNVLFIITDAQRADYLSCTNNPDFKTPNIASRFMKDIQKPEIYTI